MKVEFVKRTRIEAKAATVYLWHASQGAFLRLLPSWSKTRLVSKSPGVDVGTRVVVTTPFAGLRFTLIAEHTRCEPGKSFTDVMIKSPFKSWVHKHSFIDGADSQSELVDELSYEVPMGFLGKLLVGRSIRKNVEKLFTFRHAQTQADLAVISRYNLPKKRILVSGASGLIGSSLVPFLQGAGHEVCTLVRKTPKSPSEIFWDPATKTADSAQLEGFDAWIHLSGENIAEGRWSKARKEKILKSRTESTEFLVTLLNGLKNPPEVLLSGSAIGFYGADSAHVHTEDCEAGAGFLADVCKAWEASAKPAKCRLVELRTGIVLSAAGGALKKMVLPTKLCMGAAFGSGKQMMSWIALDDWIYACYHCLATKTVSGPVNLVAPDARDNRGFSRAVAKKLHRWIHIFPVPGFVLKVMLGEMATELLLGSCHVLPQKLEKSGFKFAYPNLEGALDHIL